MSDSTLERIEAKQDKILAFVAPPEIDDGALAEILENVDSAKVKKRICEYVFAYGQVMYKAGIDVRRWGDE